MRGELEAVRRVARFEHLPRAPRSNDAVDHADVLLLAEEVGRKMVLGDVAGLIQELAVHDGQFGAGRPEVAQAQPAVDVLPEVDNLAIGLGTGDGDRTELLHPACRRGRGVGQTLQAVVGDGDGLPCGGPGPVVLALPRHEVGGQQRPGGRPPLRASGDDDIVGMELPEEGKRAAVAVGQLEEARVPAPPAVGEHDLPLVLSTDEKVPHVVDLDVQRGRVTGEARRQLDVSDTLAVEERLVDPVRRGVDPGVCRRCRQLEGVAQHVGGPFGFVRLDPAGDPVGLFEQSRLEPGRPRPFALAAVRPDLDPPDDPLPGGQRVPGPWDEHTVFGLEPTQITAVDLDGVGLLARGAGGEPPRKARAALAETEDGGAEMLDPEVRRCVHVDEVMISLVPAYDFGHLASTLEPCLRVCRKTSRAIGGSGYLCVRSRPGPL